jgi:hypothetical protein
LVWVNVHCSLNQHVHPGTLACSWICDSCDWHCFLELFQVGFSAKELAPEVQTHLPKSLERDSPYLTHPVFNMWVILRLLHWEVTKPELLRHNLAFFDVLIGLDAVLGMWANKDHPLNSGISQSMSCYATCTDCRLKTCPWCTAWSHWDHAPWNWMPRLKWYQSLGLNLPTSIHLHRWTRQQVTRCVLSILYLSCHFLFVLPNFDSSCMCGEQQSKGQVASRWPVFTEPSIKDLMQNSLGIGRKCFKS